MGIDTAYRKTAEETNLIIKKDCFYYLVNNPIFDCNVYIAKLKEGKILE